MRLESTRALPPVTQCTRAELLQPPDERSICSTPQPRRRDAHRHRSRSPRPVLRSDDSDRMNTKARQHHRKHDTCPAAGSALRSRRRFLESSCVATSYAPPSPPSPTPGALSVQPRATPGKRPAGTRASGYSAAATRRRPKATEGECTCEIRTKAVNRREALAIRVARGWAPSPHPRGTPGPVPPASPA